MSNFSQTLQRLRSAAEGQRGRKDESCVSLYDLREILRDWERLDSIVRTVLNMGEQLKHSDDSAVDAFASAMKNKMAISRDKGKSGWDDPEECDGEHLAELFVKHLFKDNPGNFVDLANFLMMLHLRNEHPSVLSKSLLIRLSPDPFQP